VTSARISISLQPFNENTLKLSVPCYTNVAAYKIVEIRSPIAGLLQNRTEKEEQPEVPK
jgi:hypothetical protein